MLTIFQRGSYDSFETETSAAAIAQLYRSKGHLFVKVTWRADGSDPEVHRIRFIIDEGPQPEGARGELSWATRRSPGAGWPTW